MSIHVEISPRRTETLSKNKSPFRGLLARRDRGGRRHTVATFDQDFRKFADVRVETH